MEDKIRSHLRTGYTTGTCASASSKAALLSIIHQKRIEDIDVILPKGSKLKIQIKKCEFKKKFSRCSVIKDGGDDPDVTHGAEIVVDLFLTNSPNVIEIDGGEGVGIVTKPGLGLEINKPAINPVPKKMIEENIRDIGNKILKKNGIRVVISVPKGGDLAKKTDNPRLGILGGISILGTSGIVYPYSTASFAASIRQNLDVALAMGDKIVVLTTGGRSEDYAKNILSLPDHCFVKMGDFAGYTIQQCAKKGIRKAHVVGFIGKLAKMASGVKQTHVKGSKVDMIFLSNLATSCKASPKIVEQIRNANTARHVYEIVIENQVKGFFEEICKQVYIHMRKYSEEKVPIEVILFDFEGKTLARFSGQ